MNTIDSLVAPLAVCSDDELRDAAATPAARALVEQILARPRARARRRALLPAASVALVACALALLATTTLRDTPGASAAVVLRKAAAAALTERIPAPGQYLYVHSTDAYLTTAGDSPAPYSALIPHDRQVWFGPTGGRILQTNGAPTFLSDRDRERWIAAGRPSFGGPIDDRVPPSTAVDLPTDPDALYAQLKAGASGFGDRFYDEVFTEIGDDLRETSTTPAQRAALFTVAARLPGIEVTSPATDAAGRAAVAVSKNDEVSRIRYTLFFDPQTYELVGEAQSVLAGNSFGYAAGTTIGSSTTLSSAIVSSTGS